MIHYLSKINLKKYSGKTALLRVDLNVKSSGDNFRLEASLPTIKLLLKHKIKVVLVSHRGRPKGKDTKLSLRQFSGIFSKKLGKKVVFLNHFNFKKLKEEINKSSAQVFLLENVRFMPGEEKNDAKFARQLALLGDFYVNDAFAVSHRANASVHAITRFLPSYAGLLLEKEIKNLDRVRKSYLHPFTIILGGAKTAEKTGILNYFWNKADKFLLGGGPGITFFAAQGFNAGDSIVDKKAIPMLKKYVSSPKIVLPVDFMVHSKKISDIGARTAEIWGEYIRHSKTILWNGPVGIVEEKHFAKGTEALLRGIAKSKAFSVLGGGELTGVIYKLGLQKKFGFVSTGGGAMLEYLSGKKLPGIEVLKR